MRAKRRGEEVDDAMKLDELLNDSMMDFIAVLSQYIYFILCSSILPLVGLERAFFHILAQERLFAWQHNHIVDLDGLHIEP